MKHRLVALGLACGAAMGGAAHAQSSVTLAGLMDLYAGSKKYAGDNGHTSVLGSGGLTTSWFGFKGVEDLGNGLKAKFAITSFFRPDSGEYGRFDGDSIFSRDANVSLVGGFGEVLAGREMAPNFLPSIVTNPFGDSFEFSPLILHMNVPLFNASQWPATTPSDTGWSNELVYRTPNFAGFTGGVHYQFGEQEGKTGRNNVGANFVYFGGPLTLSGFYERDQISNPGESTYLGTKKKDWMLLGAYEIDFIKPSFAYGQSKADDTSIKAKTFEVGAIVRTGTAGKVLAEYAQTKRTQIDLKRKTFSMGYDYLLSKRTNVYAIYMNDRITEQTTGNSLVVGIRHKF